MFLRPRLAYGYLSADLRLFQEYKKVSNHFLMSRCVSKFKISDATVVKTSLKLASSSFSIVFIIMSVCLTFENKRDYSGTVFRGAVSKLGEKIQNRVFTFSVRLEKWPFHVADSPRTGKKCTKIEQAHERRAKLLFWFIKYANFVPLSLPSRRRSFTL